MIKAFIRDTETNGVLMDEELDGLYLVGTQRQSGGTLRAPRLMVGRDEYAKAALHIGIYDVPQKMLDTLEDFQMSKKVSDGEDDEELNDVLESMEKVLRWLNSQGKEAD